MQIPLRDSLPEALAHARAVLDTFFVARDGVFAWEARIARSETGLRLLGLAVAQKALRALYRQACEGAQGRIVRLLIGEHAPGRLAAWRSLRMPSHAPLALRLVHWPFAPPPRPAKFPHDYALARLASGGKLAEGDAMALFCWQNEVISAAFGNFFVRLQGRWYTPPVGKGVLAGCVRAALLGAGIAAERSISLAMLDEAEAAAITASGSFVRAVAAIEGRALALAPVQELRAALQGMRGVAW